MYFSQTHSFLLWCGLLRCFYELFLHSFWRHPFTAEDPLVSKWWNATFLQICSDEETNSSWITWGWAHFQQVFKLCKKWSLRLQTKCSEELMWRALAAWPARASASGSDRSMLVFWCTSYRLWRAVLNISAAGRKTLCVRLHWNVGNSFGSVRIEQEKEAVRASCLSYFCLVRARGHSVWGKEEFCSALHLVSPLKPFYELVWASAGPWWHTVLSVVEKILRHKPEKESWHLPWQAIMFCVLCFLVLW